MDSSNNFRKITMSKQPEKNLVTQEGLQNMMSELDSLKNQKLVEIAAKLKEAVAQGDLSENAEYAEAKDEQAMIILRISELEEQIKNAEIIKKGKTGKCGKEVTIGCQVTVCNKNRDEGQEQYTIVGSIEANPFEAKISNTSPLGAALLGRSQGDTVKVAAPAGEMDYEIIKVS